MVVIAIEKADFKGGFFIISVNQLQLGDRLMALVDALQAEGRYSFTRDEALAVLGVTPASLKRAAARLYAKRRLVAARRGFFVIVPLEYRVAGAPPASWFIDDLMQYLGRPYYVGVLSAAALHGAAHQQPQEFQVVTETAQRPGSVGRTRIRFLGKRRLAPTVTTLVKTETGTMRVSTPEATAVDLVRYVAAAGGLGNVATVLTELAASIDSRRLTEAAISDGELACAQRLGFILELVGVADRAAELAAYVHAQDPRNVPLQPGQSVRGCVTDRRWRVIVNEQIEADL